LKNINEDSSRIFSIFVI